MKKALYGSTALLAATFVSGQAFAVGTPMTSTNFNLTLGGFATFKFEYQSQTPNQNLGNFDADGTLADQPRPYDLDFDAELHFKGSQKLPNGTTMGFWFELETAGQELQRAAGNATAGNVFSNAGVVAANNANGSVTAANSQPGGSQCGFNRNDYIDDNY